MHCTGCDSSVASGCTGISVADSSEQVSCNSKQGCIGFVEQGCRGSVCTGTEDSSIADGTYFVELENCTNLSPDSECCISLVEKGWLDCSCSSEQVCKGCIEQERAQKVFHSV